MKKTTIVILLFFISIGVYINVIQNKDIEILTRQHETTNNQALNYLNTFDNVELDITDDDSMFAASKKVTSISGIQLLNANDDYFNDMIVDFETTYINEIGIVYMKIFLNKNGDVLDETSVIGYPFFNENISAPDISFEYFGETLLASDVLNNSVDNQAFSNQFFLVLSPDGGGGSSNSPVVNVTTPVLQISISLINSGRNLIQEGINKIQQIVPVDFWRDGPLHYLLWFAKVEKAVSNYRHNKEQTIPNYAIKDGYIDSQYGFSNWKFGFQTLNLNGCGVISLYNFMVSQNRTPSLPTLIFLSELMNADLGLGFLGLSPIDNDMMKIVSRTIQISFHLMQPLLHAVSPVVAGIITDRLITDQLNRATRWWQDMLIWASMPSQYTLTLAAVNVAIVAAVAAVDLVTEFYLSHLHGIPDILNVLGYEKLDISYLNYDSFNSGKISQGYFIITFFNDVPNFKDVESLMAHTIFVKREFENKSSLIAYNNSYDDKADNFYKFFTNNYGDRNKQFISGITIKG